MGQMKPRIWRLVHGFREPVAGAFRVTAMEWGPVGSSRITLVGVVSAPGLAPRPMSRETRYPLGRHVTEGMDLPVMVDLAQPDKKLRFLWNQVPTQVQYEAWQKASAMQQAAQTAAQMAAGSPYGGPNPYGAYLYGPTQYGSPYGQGQSGQYPAGSGGPAAQSPAGAAFAFGDFNELFANLSSGVSASFSQSSSSSTLSSGGGQGSGFSQSNVQVDFRDVAAAGPMADWPLGTAVVRAAQEAALPPMMAGFFPNGLADVTLEITPSAQPTPWIVRTNMMFPTPQLRATLTTPGSRLPVRIDPAMPTHVVIDTSAPSTGPSGV